MVQKSTSRCCENASPQAFIVKSHAADKWSRLELKSGRCPGHSGQFNATVLMIDWDRLHDYESTKSRSFEELIYHIAKVLHSGEARFTPIDDRGGGDGVEFVAQWPDGSEWGWQAKFFHPNPRLQYGNRKAQISNSLHRACEQHPNLQRWILCTPTRFTNEERAWFETTLRQVIPPGMQVELDHWSDSDLQAWLSEPRFAGKREYFFGDLELSLEWFRRQFARQAERLRGKFHPELHTRTSLDLAIHNFLAGSEATCAWEAVMRDLEELRNQFRREADQLLGSTDAELGGAVDLAVRAAERALSADFDANYVGVVRLHGLLAARDLDEFWKADPQEITSRDSTFGKTYREVKEELRSTFNSANPALQGSDRIFGKLHLMEMMAEECALRVAEAISPWPASRRPALHIFGDAGYGKTQTAAEVVQALLEQGVPALLLLGEQFTSAAPLTEQLRQVLDLPGSYTWEMLLGALATAAEAYHVRLPIVIDGLNEAIHQGAFSDVWQLGLPGLISDLRTVPRVGLITTCRTSYREVIWDTSQPENVAVARGFRSNVEEALERYFAHYRILADLTFTTLTHFTHPIYLRIFCEAKNPDRDRDVVVYIGEETLFEVFDQYLDRVNASLCRRLRRSPRTPLVRTALGAVAELLWNSNTREAPLDVVIERVDGQARIHLDWLNSITHALESEGLLVHRDMRAGHETFAFTYDLLGGYLIALSLLRDPGAPQAALTTPEVVSRLFGDRRHWHSLAEDIRRSLATLLPTRFAEYLHQIVDGAVALSASVEAIFEIPPAKLSAPAVDLIERLYGNPANRATLFDLARPALAHPGHPLNIRFWSDRLSRITMAERDVSWTEWVRTNEDWAQAEARRLESLAGAYDDHIPHARDRLRLQAETICWFLTTTNRRLRDLATRALYSWGRIDPEGLLEVLTAALDVNDPYVGERVLAASYGVAMARQHDFADPSFAEYALPKYGRFLYESMFSPAAPHGTTHILARDYARHTVEIALLHHSSLLNPEQIERVRPPFTEGGIRIWGEAEHSDLDAFPAWSAPVQMDFGNYTVGQLVEGRENYRNDHPEYQKVMRNLYWRIYNLGYSHELFERIDTLLANRTGARVGDDPGRTERYGKKYAWIAFFEIAGYRVDQGLWAPWMGGDRISDTNLDPSFPQVRSMQRVDGDFLGDRTASVWEWVAQGEDPDFGTLTEAEQLQAEAGPWVLLNGYVSQEDPPAHRRRWVYLRGLLVRRSDLERLLGRLEEQDLGGRWLPEIPDDHYTFAGEIPWCDTFAPNGWTELEFITSKRTVLQEEDRIALYRDGVTITESERDVFFEQLRERLPGPDETASRSQEDLTTAFEVTLEEMGLTARLEKVQVQTQENDRERIEVMIPVRQYSWEGYHSVVTPGLSMVVPTREIGEHLRLVGQPQTFDLFTTTGIRASFSYEGGNPMGTGEEMCFLRRDLLERYLEETDQALVWGVWGEREYTHEEPEHRRAVAKTRPVYKVFQQVIQYSRETPS